MDVEIGFGLGEFIVRLAQEHPERNFVGIEQDWQRMKKALRRIEQVNQGRSLSQTLDNIRLLQVDAWVAFMRLFPQRSIDRVFALFPCPWPKERHTKHRLFSRDFLRLVNSRLKDAGQVQIVTDHHPFFAWMMSEMTDTGFSVGTKLIEPQFDTKFERKWCREGHKEFLELQLQKQKHWDVPVEEDEALRVYFVKDFDPDRFAFDDVTGETSIILKDFIYDAARKKGMIHLVVAEPGITQHVWVVIVQGAKGWCIAKAEGHTALPTRGVAQALRVVYKTALNNSR